jgi:hypothetical protein
MNVNSPLVRPNDGARIEHACAGYGEENLQAARLFSSLESIAVHANNAPRISPSRITAASLALDLSDPGASQGHPSGSSAQSASGVERPHSRGPVAH